MDSRLEVARFDYEPVVIVGAIAAVVAAIGVAITGKRSTRVAATIAAAVVVGQAAAARSLVSPVATVEDARSEGAAEILDAVAESRLDPDLWEAIRAAPAAVYPTDDPDALDPSHPHGKGR